MDKKIIKVKTPSVGKDIYWESFIAWLSDYLYYNSHGCNMSVNEMIRNLRNINIVNNSPIPYITPIENNFIGARLLMYHNMKDKMFRFIRCDGIQKSIYSLVASMIHNLEHRYFGKTLQDNYDNLYVTGILVVNHDLHDILSYYILNKKNNVLPLDIIKIIVSFWI